MGDNVLVGWCAWYRYEMKNLTITELARMAGKGRSGAALCGGLGSASNPKAYRPSFSRR